MSPLRGEEFTGRSVEEAIERGLRSLGRKRTDVDIEVLEKGKPANVLGIGGEDARVLLTFQEDESPAEPQPVIDEAEVPRRPDALRERADESEAEEASPVLAEESRRRSVSTTGRGTRGSRSSGPISGRSSVAAARTLSRCSRSRRRSPRGRSAARCMCRSTSRDIAVGARSS